MASRPSERQRDASRRLALDRRSTARPRGEPRTPTRVSGASSCPGACRPQSRAATSARIHASDLDGRRPDREPGRLQDRATDLRADDVRQRVDGIPFRDRQLGAPSRRLAQQRRRQADATVVGGDPEGEQRIVRPGDGHTHDHRARDGRSDMSALGKRSADDRVGHRASNGATARGASDSVDHAAGPCRRRGWRDRRAPPAGPTAGATSRCRSPSGSHQPRARASRRSRGTTARRTRCPISIDIASAWDWVSSTGMPAFGGSRNVSGNGA